MRTRSKLMAGIAASALLLTLASAPSLVQGADHLDAPALSPPSGRFDADINDLYVFEGSNPGRTVIAMTTHPAAGVFSPLTYATDVDYLIHIDTNGDAMPETTYGWRFEAAANGHQEYTVTRYRGKNARTLNAGAHWARGMTGENGAAAGGARIFAGLRSDPFFFDLDAFLGAVAGVPNGRTFCDGSETDFFAALNVNALVMELKDVQVGRTIAVWATTSENGTRIDRMGRPAINTVFNAGADKNAFNAGMPKNDLADFGANVEGVLAAFSALDSEGAYSGAETAILASVLLPDVVTYDTSTAAAGPLNGRALADDVIDAELNIVTGGFPFPGRNATGAIPTDCVDAHTDLLSGFPYLGEPHA